MRVRILSSAAIVAVGALALAACGGQSSSSHSSTARSSSSSPPTTAPRTATATAANTATASSDSTAAGASPCLTSDLHLSLVSGQGAAGTAYTTYALRNVGPGPCTMVGYPGVAILDAQGRIVQHPAQRGVPTPVAVRVLKLRPGQHATFTVTSSDVIPSPGCQHGYVGTTLQVFPPNQRAALRLPHREQFCNLRVGPVQSGR